MPRVVSNILTACIFILLASCSNLAHRFGEIGQKPKLSKINVYDSDAYYRALMNNSHNKAHFDSKSLFESDADQNKGGRLTNSVWRDESAIIGYKVGDIVSVVVYIKDQAKLNNKTQKSRSGKTSMGTPSLFGLETQINQMLNKDNGANSLLSINNVNNSNGAGKIDRSENINMTVAATIVSMLPNGNFIVKGSQEIRVNYEAREVTVEGIVNPMDIDNKGAIKLNKVAEARVSYGGRGHISNYQQDPYGKQLIDIISPF